MKNAVILAAGRGERLWPYGDTNAKAALSVGTRPLIQWQLDSLAEVGVERVRVVAGYLDGMVRNACALWLEANPDRMQIDFVEQRKPDGTAAAAALGFQGLDDDKQGGWIIPGDLYFHTNDLKKLLDRSKQSGVAVLVAPVPSSHVQETIRVEVEGGSIQEVCAHSRVWTPNTRRFTGIVAASQVFIETLETTPDIPTCVEIGGMAPVDRELAETLHQWLKSGETAVAVEAEEAVVDINKPWDFLEANRISTLWQTEGVQENVLADGASIDPSARIEGKVKLGKGSRIGPGVIVYGNLVVGENSTVTDGAFIEESVVVGDGCRIWRGALVGNRTVIGHGCNVGHGAEFEGLMLPESYSYHYGEFWGILGRCADLGAATVCGTLRFDDGQTAHRVKGRREVPRYHSNATYLGDFVRTGVNAILMPGVKVGPYSLIGAGVLLSEEVPNNTSVFVEQTHRKGSWGPERYGW
ncbi:MAG: NTP transferase domain-containing protein [Candidatus Omnitrophica bacterium]|nr:NTP transferase domain-containing protein [Candidatus Omnitrophota bacterium]